MHDPGGLGPGYEQGNVFAYRYDSETIPGDQRLQADLGTMLQMLDVIYAADEETTDPFSEVLRSVLELQRSYSRDGNTPEMQLRGRLLKQDGPRALQPLLSEIPGLSFDPDVEVGEGPAARRGSRGF